MTHSTSCRFAALGLMAVCAASGCWQEVEYVEPPTTAESSPISATEKRDANAASQSGEMLSGAQRGDPQFDETQGSELNDDAEKFADDLAAELATEPLGEAAPVDDISVPPASPTAATETDSLFGEPSIGPSAAERQAVSESAPPEEPIADVTDIPSTGETASTAEQDPLFGEPTSAPPMADTESTQVPSEGTGAVDAASNVADSSPLSSAKTASYKVQRAAWLLGSKLSLAALAHGQGAPGEDVQTLLAQARTLARPLGVEVPDLPPRPITAASENPMPDKELKYLFAAGQRIGAELANRYGPEAAALFELAVKSNILLVLYRPSSAAVDDLAAALSQAGSRSKLPAPLWQPLVDLLTQQASPAAVRAAVLQMHAAVDAQLAKTVEEVLGAR